MGFVEVGALLVAFGVFVLIIFLLMTIARFMGFIRQVPPSQALIVTGVRCRSRLTILRRKRVTVEETDEEEVGLGFRIVTEEEEVVLNYKVIKGGMTLVFPWIQRAEVLDLRVREREIMVENVLSHNAVPITVDGIVQLAIGEDDTSIFTAARLQLEKELEEALDAASETLQGHLRAIIGLMSVEDVYKNRELFAQRVYEVAYDDLAGLGFEIVSFVIKEISDEVGYLDALGQPEIQAVLRDARIATAVTDRDATKEEQDARMKMAEFTKNTDVAKADYDAEVARQQAVAERAMAISLAEQDQALETQRTEAARIAAERADRELDATVRRPSDASRYAVQQEAAASLYKAQQEADAGKARGFAQADVIQKTGEAEGEAAKARGLAGAEVNRVQLLAEAEGGKAKLLAQAEGTGQLVQAQNLYGPNALRLVLMQAFLEGLPEVFKNIAEPMKAIDQISIVDLGSTTGGADGGAQPAMERFTDQLLRTFTKVVKASPALFGDLIDDIVVAAGFVGREAEDAGVVETEAVEGEGEIEEVEASPREPTQLPQGEPDPEAPAPRQRRRLTRAEEEAEEEERE